MIRRILRRVQSGDQGKCRCGLRRAYIVDLTFERRNGYGLLVPITDTRSFCTTHGKQYAAKWKLEVQS